MSNDGNRARPRAGGSFALTAALAAGALATVAAVDHIQAQEENRPSAVQQIFRWFSEDVLGVDSSSARTVGTRSGAQRLSRRDIEELPTSIYGERPVRDAQDEKSFCAVCQESFSPRDHVMRLPCFHEYHTDCIGDYLSTTESPLCPICRHPVSMSS